MCGLSINYGARTACVLLPRNIVAMGFMKGIVDTRVQVEYAMFLSKTTHEPAEAARMLRAGCLRVGIFK